MINGRQIIFSVLSLFLCLFFVSCTGGTAPVKLGLKNSKLAACPTSPNCVSSDASDAKHRIDPFLLTAPPAEVWQKVQSSVAALPRTKIVIVEGNYLRAECRSAVFGFVDDLELHLRPDEMRIAVRSEARLGYSDFGVNRKRVEALRSEFLQQGLIK